MSRIFQVYKIQLKYFNFKIPYSFSPTCLCAFSNASQGGDLPRWRRGRWWALVLWCAASPAERAADDQRSDAGECCRAPSITVYAHSICIVIPQEPSSAPPVPVWRSPAPLCQPLLFRPALSLLLALGSFSVSTLSYTITDSVLRKILHITLPSRNPQGCATEHGEAVPD